ALLQRLVVRVVLASFTAVVRWQELSTDELVQPVQIDVREDGAHDSSLRRTAQSGVILPIFEIACPEQVLNKPQKTAIVELFAEHRQQDLVVNVVEAPFDVALNEPHRTCPLSVDIPK